MRHFALLLLAAVVSPPAWAGMYKWVDEKGVTHYGDSIPPQYASQANTELNKRGMVIRKTDAALTPEQIQARQEEAARKKEEAAQAAEQKRKDKSLLDTYTSEKEIDLVRDRNLQQSDLVIKSTQQRIKSVQGRLDQLKKQADALTRGNKPVPQDIQTDIRNAEQELARLAEIVSQKQKDTETIRARFEADKKRYRELAAENSGKK